MKQHQDRTVLGILGFLRLFLRSLILSTGLIVLCACSRESGSSDQQGLTLKVQCREVGDRLSKEWRSKYSGVQFNEEPEFAYNRQLNTCLYADSYSDATSVLGETHVTHDQFVIDVLTNRVLAEFRIDNGKAVVDEKAGLISSQEEFQKRKAELLGHTQSAK